MSFDFSDIMMPVVFTGVFLLVAWTYGRAIRGRKPFTPFMKGLTLYASVFTLGMAYLMMVGGKLHWAPRLLFAVIAAWGLLLVSIALWRRRGTSNDSGRPSGVPARVHLNEGLPTVALLVCLIASAIEWEFVYKGNGHWLVALAWTAGVAGSIWLARRNRRMTVVVALRALVGLLVIGAIAQASLPALFAAATAAVVLFLLEKLWKRVPPTLTELGKLEAPPEHDLH